MRNINSSALNKQSILSKLSQVTIFATYLGLPVEVIQHCIDTGELICNPLRIDNHPTAGFKYNNKGKLKFKDFGNDEFWGDCFDIVALIMSSVYKKQYDISNKDDFIKVLRHITFTFKDVFYGGEKDINLINDINAGIANIRHKKPVIELVVREWNKEDERYWNQFGVSLNYLNINFIYPVEQYYINRKVNPEPKYYYKVDDPCYAYYLGKDRNNVLSFKLYFPKRTKGVIRFITNCNHLEGILNLDRNDYDVVVITKSTKDRVSLGAMIDRMISLYGQDTVGNIGVINIPHETYRLRQNEYDWIRSKTKLDGTIVSLMDNDKTGKYEAIWLRDNYRIVPILIPAKYDAKDFAELSAKYDFDTIRTLLNETIEYIKHYEERNNAEASKLAWDTSQWNSAMPY